jgi:HAT1-interacting factor 1
MSEQSPIVIEPTPEPAAAATTTTELPKTKEKVEELNRAASLQYKLKNFSQAADHFADAVEIQAELNGEMAPENAELLFYYGRALYKVAIAKSDVLGGRVAQEEKKKPKKAKKSAGEGSSSNTGAANGAGKAADEEETFESKPYFQITGDENWTDSEDEDEDGEEQRGEEQDDFGDAYEVFEMARVLYTRQLENLDASESAEKGKGKTELSTQARTIKEKLADCHGFLVEISLENERYLDAVGDARSAVTLQEELHPIEHENVTEAHYSLSLALEFASTAAAFTEKEGEPPSDAPPKVDWDLRNDAIKHTELAAEGLEKRLEKEKAALTSSTLTPAEKKEKETIVGEKDALVEELKQRVRPPSLPCIYHKFSCHRPRFQP